MEETLDSENKQVSNKESKGKSNRGQIGFLIILTIITIINSLAGLSNSSALTNMSQSIDTMQETLNSTTQKFNELSQNINNNIESQTALLHRTIGDVLPVVVPEKSRAEFDAVKQSVAVLKNDMSDENLSTAVDLYTDFIQTTAPWIQEELTSEIMEAKSAIDYCAILNTYKNDNDVETAVDSLQTFIISNSGYSELKDVIAKYNAIVEEQNKLYDKAITDITARAKTMLEKKTASYVELQTLLTDMEQYQDDEAVAQYIPPLYTCMTEAASLEETLKDADTLYQQIHNGDMNLAEEMYTVYANQLAQCLYNANSISTLDNSALIGKINECKSALVSYEKQIEKNAQTSLANQIRASIATYKKEIANISSDSMANTKLSIIANQLASLQFSAGSIGEEERASVLSDIDSCISQLKVKEKSLETSNSGYDAKIKKYNEWGLSEIESVNTEIQSLAKISKKTKAEKTAARKDLLIRLEKIQTNYLYTPVAVVYQQVWQEIWGELNKDEQLDVSKRAVSVTKVDL